MLVSILIHKRKIGRGNRVGIERGGFAVAVSLCLRRSAAVRRFVFIVCRRFLRGYRVVSDAGKVSGHVVHKSGQRHEAHEDEQNGADLNGIAHHAAVFFEKSEHRSGKKTDSDKRQDEAQRVHADEEKAFSHRGGGARHQKHAAERRADAGRPCEAEGKAEQKCRDRPHGKAVEAQREPVLLLYLIGAPEDTELIETKKYHEDTAETGEPYPVSGKEPSECREAKPEEEEGKADTKNKKQGIEHYFFSGVGNGSVLFYLFCAAGKIADVERDERQDAGGEKAQDTLQKHGKRRNARFNVKIHAK